MYIWLSATRLRRLTKYVRKCVFASVFKHLFFLNKQKAQETRSLLYVIYWEPGRGLGGSRSLLTMTADICKPARLKCYSICFSVCVCVCSCMHAYKRVCVCLLSACTL